VEVVEEDATFKFSFNTRNSSGPITLAGTPTVYARVDGSDTEITSGLSIEVDNDSKTGEHQVTVDLSASASYVLHSRVELFLGGGPPTVGGVSVLGEKLYQFVIGPLSSSQMSESINTTNSDVSGVVSDLTALIADIGANGSGLTALPWNAAWDAEVQSECADALTAYDPPTRAEATTNKEAILAWFLANRVIDVSAKTETIYDTDNVTPLATFDLKGADPLHPTARKKR
jgi:hypothetical protein